MMQCCCIAAALHYAKSVAVPITCLAPSMLLQLVVAVFGTWQFISNTHDICDLQLGWRLQLYRGCLDLSHGIHLHGPFCQCYSFVLLLLCPISLWKQDDTVYAKLSFKCVVAVVVVVIGGGDFVASLNVS